MSKIKKLKKTMTSIKDIFIDFFKELFASAVFEILFKIILFIPRIIFRFFARLLENT